MTSKALPVCLLLLSGCGTSPLPRPQDPRAAWAEQTRAIQPSWGRKELEAFLDGIRVPSPHQPSVLGGGWSMAESGPVVVHGLYSLDAEFSLYVVWKEETSTRGIRSTEVTCFSDLRNRIAPDLFDAVKAIHQSPSAQQGLGFSSLRLIRAVNTLQPMGKEKALKALWEYCRLVRSLSVDGDKYNVDEYRVLPIVQLLFESPIGWMPEFQLGAGDIASPSRDAWPLFPIAVVQDVPFMMVSGYMLAGQPEAAADRLRLKLGPLRSSPLSPRVTPLEAADELTQSAAWTSLKLGPGNEGRKKWQIRRQALGAVASVFALRPEESSNDCCVDPTETQWRAAVERATSSGLIWSPEIQDFILGR